MYIKYKTIAFDRLETFSLKTKLIDSYKNNDLNSLIINAGSQVSMPSIKFMF
jgi:hypothetical protein